MISLILSVLSGASGSDTFRPEETVHSIIDISKILSHTWDIIGYDSGSQPS